MGKGNRNSENVKHHRKRQYTNPNLNHDRSQNNRPTSTEQSRYLTPQSRKALPSNRA